MLLHPIPHYARFNRLEGKTLVSTWLSDKDIEDLYTEVWPRGESTLPLCRVLEVVILPKDIHRPQKLRDALVHYQLLNARYVDDLFADPSIDFKLVMCGGVEHCFIYQDNLPRSEHWYCDPDYRYDDRSWIPEWLNYAGERQLYYYGTGRGANALFYFPTRTEEVRAEFEGRFVDEDAGSYVPAWFFNQRGKRVRRDGLHHAHMNSSAEGYTTEEQLTGEPGFLQRCAVRVGPILLWDTPGNMDIIPLANILHRNHRSNVLAFFHANNKEAWVRVDFHKSLRDFRLELRSIAWKGEEWVLVEINQELLISVVTRTLQQLRTETILDLAQVLHAQELIAALGSDGNIQFHKGFKEYYAATKDVMVLPINTTNWVRGQNLRAFRDYEFDFGPGVLGAWWRDPSYEKARPGFGRFVKPLTPIPPGTTGFGRFTTEKQNTDWFKENMGRSDSLEEFGRKVLEHMRTDLPPLKFIRPGHLDLGKMADELSAVYGAPRDNVQRMLDIWVQYVNQDHLNDPDRHGTFDRARPTGEGGNRDNELFDRHGCLNLYEIAARARRLRGRYVLRHRDTGVKVYVVRRRYGMVTLQSEDGQEFVLNNDIVETVYDKEEK